MQSLKAKLFYNIFKNVSSSISHQKTPGRRDSGIPSFRDSGIPGFHDYGILAFFFLTHSFMNRFC